MLPNTLRSATTRGKILFADDDPLTRRPIAVALHRAGFTVTSVAARDDVAPMFAQEPFDALLLDISQPGGGWLDVVDRLGAHPRLPIVVLTDTPTVSSAVDALRRGIADYVTKPVDITLLLVRLDAAIERGRAICAISEAREQAAKLLSTVAAIEAILGLPRAANVEPPRSAESLNAPDPLGRLDRPELESLSPREQDVLRLLALGNPVAEISKALDISANTVRNHVKNIFVKLRVRSQVALLGKLAGHTGSSSGSN